MKETVPVVFATDQKFAPYCSVSIASLINTRAFDRNYDVYVLYDELEIEDIEKLTSMSVDNVKITCINITQYIDSKLLYTRGRQSVATYYRFFVAEALPNYSKILYLDSDIVILRDVGELFDIDQGENILAGVVIYRGKPEEKKQKETYLENMLYITPEEYINAGILIINLEEFRKQNICQKCIDYITEHRDLRWMDQDVLNAVCKGKIYFLPEEWNKSQLYYEEDYSLGRNLTNVGILHYLDRYKPWLVGFRRCYLFFYQAASYSPYVEFLNQEFLKCNKEGCANPKAEILKMSAQCQVGPRYFSKCLLKWAEGKTKLFLNRKKGE